ncbi:hypothetical protein MGA3_07625 [Bacillus methanolicus MGA3]|nr:hypothetical protein MGA3_07625 [Bacillus methanolicus MGA3]
MTVGAATPRSFYISMVNYFVLSSLQRIPYKIENVTVKQWMHEIGTLME